MSAFGLVAVLVVPVRDAAGSEASRRATADKFRDAYNLQFSACYARLDEALRLDPADPAPSRVIAAITWLEILFAQGAATFEPFTGQASSADLARPVPPPLLTARFATNVARALRLADARLANTRDADAYYQVGASAALAALYKATVEGRMMGSLRDGRRAVDAMEKSRALDPSRRDTGLVLGMSRYTVSTLPRLTRTLAGWLGLPGNREKAFALMEDAASQGASTEDDALLVLMVVYNREGRFAEAQDRLSRLQSRFPGNRLLWLNAVATAIEANDFAAAERELVAGAAKRDGVTSPAITGEHGLWLLKSGTAHAASGRVEDARVDLAKGLTVGPRDWVRGRIHFQLARLAAAAKDAVEARTQLALALAFAKRSGDVSAANAAENLLKKMPGPCRSERPMTRQAGPLETSNRGQTGVKQGSNRGQTHV
jgi:tetratricopeptide (TPR) repeat protein